MNRIKELRKEKGINQTDLAEILNVQRTAVSKYETGTIPLTDSTITALKDYFGVTADYLLGLSDNPNPNSDKSDDVNLDELEFALFGEVRELTEEDKAELIRMARRMRELDEFKKQTDKR